MASAAAAPAGLSGTRTNTPGDSPATPVRLAARRRYCTSGVGAARQPWIFQMDCDNQFDPEELAELVALADEADMIIGVRALRLCRRAR